MEHKSNRLDLMTIATPIAVEPEFSIISYGPFLLSTRVFFILLMKVGSFNLISDNNKVSGFFESNALSLLFSILKDLSVCENCGCSDKRKFLPVNVFLKVSKLNLRHFINWLH